MTDEQYEALSCPQITVVVRSLANDPNYIKCPRCWHYTHEGLSNHDGLCDRCINVLRDVYPNDPRTIAALAKREESKT